MKTDSPFKSKDEVDKWYRESINGLGALLALEVQLKGTIRDPSTYLTLLGYLKSGAERGYELLDVKENFQATEINGFCEFYLGSKTASMGM